MPIIATENTTILLVCGAQNGTLALSVSGDKIFVRLSAVDRRVVGTKE